jgi:hypothetical protein
MKIRCIECYKQRPGGRCDFCPLHRKNRHKYKHIGDGWYIPAEKTEVYSGNSFNTEESGPSAESPTGENGKPRYRKNSEG